MKAVNVTLRILFVLFVATLLFASCSSSYHCRPSYFVGYGAKNTR